jgi:hypothetical protein
MRRISILFVLSSALAVLGSGALPSIARAIEIKTPQVTMPHLSVPQVKTPHPNTRISAPQLNTHVITLEGGANKTSKTTGLQKRIDTTVGKVNPETVGGARLTTVSGSSTTTVGLNSVVRLKLAGSSSKHAAALLSSGGDPALMAVLVTMMLGQDGNLNLNQAMATAQQATVVKMLGQDGNLNLNQAMATAQQPTVVKMLGQDLNLNQSRRMP